MDNKRFKKMLERIVSPDFDATAIEVRSVPPLTDMQARELAEALKRNPNITGLDLFRDLDNDAIRGQEGIKDQGAIALAHVSHLKEINLDCNQITEVGAAELAKSKLTKLSLCGNPIHYKNRSHDNFQKMIDNLCKNKTIIHLDLNYCIIPDKMIAQLISKNNTIQTFTTSKDLTDKALEFIGNNTTLQELYIYNITFTKQGIEYLAKNSSLRTLRIERSNIDDNGARTLSAHPSLQDLTLIDSNITNEGTKNFYGCNIDKVTLFNATKQRFASHSELEQFQVNFENYKKYKQASANKNHDEKQMAEYDTDKKYNVIDQDETSLIGDNQDET